MAQSKYGRDNIATIIRRHGMRMNRVLRIAFLFVAVPSANYTALFADDLRLHDEPVRNAEAIWCALAGAVFFVLADRSFSLKLKFEILTVPFSLPLELPLLAATWPAALFGLNTQSEAPCGRVY